MLGQLQWLRPLSVSSQGLVKLVLVHNFLNSTQYRVGGSKINVCNIDLS